MIKLLRNYQVKSYDMMIDRTVTLNMNKTGISRNIPPTAAAIEHYLQLLAKRLKREV